MGTPFDQLRANGQALFVLNHQVSGFLTALPQRRKKPI
jgi:hypothetical protein